MNKKAHSITPEVELISNLYNNHIHVLYLSDRVREINTDG